MEISELKLPALPHLKITRTASGRYAGEMVEVKALTIAYADGHPTDCCFTVEVSTGAIIEVHLDDVESAE